MNIDILASFGAAWVWLMVILMWLGITSWLTIKESEVWETTWWSFALFIWVLATACATIYILMRLLHFG